VWDVTQSEREEAANTLLNCIDAVFKQMKLRDPAAHPWIGVMKLDAESLRVLGTSVFIQLNRRGEGVSHPPQDAPAAPQSRPDGKTASDTSKPVRTRPKAPAGPAKPGLFVCPACGETKTWAMDWGPFPNSVCIDCYKAGRTP